MQPVSLHIQGLTEVPIQISTVDDCCTSSEFGIHSQTSSNMCTYVYKNIFKYTTIGNIARTKDTLVAEPSL